MRGGNAITAAIALWAVWTLTTWLLEGRVETFLHPEAIADRLVYTGVANVLVGIVGAALLVRSVTGQRCFQREAMGFGPPVRTAIWVPIGLALGIGLYFGQGAPSANPTVILNAYAQVFVVSVAEVLVCWAVLAGILSQATSHTGPVSILVAVVVAGVLFGLYHFAHSPPFDRVPMVAFLTLVGLLTGAFFFLSRDVYATIGFHNFLGVFGVVRALSTSGKLVTYDVIQLPLLVTAVVALAILIIADIRIIRGNAA